VGHLARSIVRDTGISTAVLGGSSFVTLGYVDPREISPPVKPGGRATEGERAA
jgi:hypothetical protein